MSDNTKEKKRGLNDRRADSLERQRRKEPPPPKAAVRNTNTAYQEGQNGTQTQRPVTRKGYTVQSRENSR
ncbi:hypothetical protein C922_05450 [Plasmodium inui San Antonio 1]|uniref:Uncharacterized protein n=1 Tax=Plasmodium inui San Antonio 1 TaxID=1237626 RepID=W7A4Y5_9APIC|nr:hypothetical protein C922_05450 [Plasmodium inui San Antonio 1]EUD64169.1 hypothetical protein C922_05450 [Plasmodium inui San Antonio 1]